MFSRSANCLPRQLLLVNLNVGTDWNIHNKSPRGTAENLPSSSFFSIDININIHKTTTTTTSTTTSNWNIHSKSPRGVAESLVRLISYEYSCPATSISTLTMSTTKTDWNIHSKSPWGAADLKCFARLAFFSINIAINYHINTNIKYNINNTNNSNMNGSIKYNINISIKNNTRLKFSQQKPLNTAGQVKQKASKSSSAFFCLGFTVLDEALLCSFFSSTTLASSSVGELLHLARAQELYIEVCYQDTEVAIRRSRLAAAQQP